MKAQILTHLFLLIFCFRSLYAQVNPVIVYQELFGGSKNDELFNLLISDTLVYLAYFAGNSYSNDGHLPGNGGGSDGWIGRKSLSGSGIYDSKNYGGSGDDVFYHGSFDFQLSKLNAVGFTRSIEVPSFHNGDDVYLIVLDTSGTIINEKAFGGSGNESGRYISPSLAGFHLVLSFGDITADGDWTGATDYDQLDIGVLKLDGSYNVVDKKIFGTSSFGFDIVYKAYYDGSGITVLASTNATGGSFSTPIKGGDDILVFKIDEALSLYAEYRYGGTAVEYGYDIKQHPDGGFFVAGASWSDQWFQGGNNEDIRDISCTTDASFNPNAIVFRADASGNIIWTQCLEGSDWDFAQACYYQHPDILYVIGYTASNDVDFPAGNPGSYDAFIAALDANTGEKKWIKVYGGSLADYGYDLIRLNDGNLLTLNSTMSTDGDITGTHHGESDAWIVEFTNPTGIEEPSPVVEVLAYPNPAEEYVTIDLPSNDPVDLIEIVNAHNQVIATEYPKRLENVIDVSSYSNGFYFVRIRQDQKTYYAKMVVLK